MAAPQICEISDELQAKLKRFRFRKEKTNAAIIMKINPKTLEIFAEHELTDMTIEDVVNELPFQQPRFIGISYCLHHDDGRTSYPIIFVFVSPQDVKPELQMLYAGSKVNLVTRGEFTKVMECRDVEELTEEAIIAFLKRYL